MRAFLSVACLCLLSSPALATIAIGTASLAIPALSASSLSLAGVTLSSSAVAGTLGALSLLGVAKAGALLGSALPRRSKREAEKVDNVLFISILKLEEDKCVRRFVCEVATGKLQAPEYLPAIKALQSANLELEVDSPKFVYSEAVKSGSKHTSVQKCQEKYSCPKTGAEIYSAMANIGF